ncbi:hypothetical protein ASPZODRAFT_2130135 [Penicilliopsis zonata CBS 506.65]|uniref:DNA repair protein rad9 n=1 Tax=Penicilliopsis zonata CBS 506.65 TaxID=1073090 RepID=A0A1L9SI40_9EURO|nr:hypothetical protein ASPZODRAFT_2130135 [Penicilliopsis zonata CBS 506.65]OJJ46704.1 hypothetical protein ASPZODRAFT_2130135 [Penicilliopsis zonata CBS 506.65]
MTSLSFSLAPDALVKLHNTLICLSKFSDSVTIEAEQNLLRLSTLNSTRTAYSAFGLEADKFFQSYAFSRRIEDETARADPLDRFCCQIYLKALLSVFKGRANEKDKDTAVELCEVELYEDEEQTACRLAVRMICGLGVIKSYKLTYEPISAQHAVFDRSRATNQWAIEPKFLKEIIDHFSLSAEQLDISVDAGKAVFTSFTTKITDGKEVLKQPVHTSVAIAKQDFDEFLAEENLHVAINLKDFKSVVSHADSLDATITARYTRPCRPLQLAYEIEGLRCEFTLMTRGEADGEQTSSSSRSNAPQLSARQTPVPIPVRQVHSKNTNDNAPPVRTQASSRSIRPLTGNSTLNTQRSSSAPKPPAASVDLDSLFVPVDDDRQWDEPNYEAQDEDVLGWDATGDQEPLGRGLRDTEPASASHQNQTEPSQEGMGIPPTQRMSQVRGLGLFD